MIKMQMLLNGSARSSTRSNRLTEEILLENEKEKEEKKEAENELHRWNSWIWPVSSNDPSVIEH